MFIRQFLYHNAVYTPEPTKEERSDTSNALQIVAIGDIGSLIPDLCL